MERLRSSLKSLLFLTLLATFAGCASSPNRAAVGVDGDPAITRDVEQALFHETSLRTSIIHVRTEEGVVRLTGMVEKAPYVHTAMEIAGNVPGVVEVQDFLFVKDPGKTGGR